MLSRLMPAALLLLGTSLALASEKSSYDLKTIIVTATRTARTADETLVPVTVITRRDTERSQAHLTLRYQPR